MQYFPPLNEEGDYEYTYAAIPAKNLTVNLVDLIRISLWSNEAQTFTDHCFPQGRACVRGGNLSLPGDNLEGTLASIVIEEKIQ